MRSNKVKALPSFLITIILTLVIFLITIRINLDDIQGEGNGGACASSKGGRRGNEESIAESSSKIMVYTYLVFFIVIKRNGLNPVNKLKEFHEKKGPRKKCYQRMKTQCSKNW